MVLPPDNERKFLGLFVKEKSFYRVFLSLLAIITLQHVANIAVNLADNLMLGSYTELALSGASIVNQIQSILQMSAAGFGMGVVVLGSQYWGQGKTGPIKKIISMAIKFAFILGVIFFAVTKLFPHTVLSAFTTDEAVIQEGMRYLDIMSWTYIIFAVSNSLMFALQAVETAFIGTVMSVSTLCINICLNYCLIFGNFGFPELGIRGAAFATLTSRVVELIIVVVYVLAIDKKLKSKIGELLQFDFTLVKDFIRVSMPVVVTGLLWGVCQAAQTMVLGHIDITVDGVYYSPGTCIAATSIAMTVYSIFSVVYLSSANATQIVIGKTIGQGDLHKIRAYSKTLQGLFIIIGIVSALLLFLLREPIVGIYSVSPEAKDLAIQFLTVFCVTVLFSSFEYPIEGGIIAGGGWTSYQAWMDNLFIWLISIPCACLSAFVFHFPPVVTFACLKVDQLLKTIPNTIVCNRFRWARILTRDSEG